MHAFYQTIVKSFGHNHATQPSE